MRVGGLSGRFGLYGLSTFHKVVVMHAILTGFLMVCALSTTLWAQVGDFDDPLLVQAVQAQSVRDYAKAQALFEEYIKDLSKEEQTLYRNLAQVAWPEDLEIYRDADTEKRAELIDRFWRRLDPSPLTKANERLIEHYRRVAYARRYYGQGQFPWDDRGEVYVRFGKPDHTSKSGDIQNEMDREIQDARQNYVNRKRIALRIRPGQPIFPVPAMSWWEYWVYADLEGGTEFDFVRRGKGNRYEFAPMPDGLSLSLTTDLLAYQSEVVLRQVTAHQPSVFDADIAALPVDFYYFPAGFRGEDGTTRLEIYYGLPAEEMARLPVDDKTDQVMLDRGLAMFDSLWSEVYRVQDQLTFQAPSDQQVLEGAFIPGVLAFEVDAGLHYLSFQIRDVVSGKSQVYQQSLSVSDFSQSDDLLMSDIALAFYVGPSDEQGPFQKRGLKIIPMASKAFRPDQNAFVYFEVYNLKRDEFGRTKYRVDYSFRAQEKGLVPIRALRGLGRMLRLQEKRREVVISYEQSGDTPEDIAYVELDLKDAEPGGQEVRVKVTDLLADRDVKKEIAFKIVP